MAKNKKLVPKEETRLPIPQPQRPLGLEEAKEDEDLIIPRYRVIQPVSKIGGDPGNFFNNVTKRVKDTIRCVFMRLQRTRVYWDAEDLEAPPLCASNDAKQPRPEYANEPWVADSTGCHDCPNSLWKPDGERPECALGYAFLGVDLEDAIPFFITFARTSARTGKEIISAFLAMREPALFSRPVVLSTEVQEDKRGKWYVIRHELGDPLPDSDFQAARVWFEQLGGVEIQPDLAQEGEEQEDIPF